MSGTYRGAVRTPGVPILSAYDAAILATSGLVGYWPLAGNGVDLTGHGHDGTLVASPTNTTFLNGDAALAFNGTTQYVTVPDHAALSVPATGILTIEAWIRPDALDWLVYEGSGDYVYWCGKQTTSATGCEWAGRMYSYTGGSTQTPSRANRISGYVFNLQALPGQPSNLGSGSNFQDPVVVGDWIHYVLVINTTDTSVSVTYPGYTKIFKNGVQRDQDNLVDYSITPQDGPATMRIGTGTETLSSLFHGAIAKFAVYNRELTATEIHDHYRSIVPAATGSIEKFAHVGDTSAAGTATKVNITVASPVPAGCTVVVHVGHTYTSGAPTVADSRGNTYTKTTTNADGATTKRVSTYSAPLHVGLDVGDVIQAVFPSAVNPQLVTADAFTGVAFTSPLDQVKGGSGTGTTPGTNVATAATTQADEVIAAALLVGGPNTDTYTEDSVGEFHTLTPIGTNTGGTDLTMHTAYRSVRTTGTWKYQPLLGTSRPWVEVLSTLKAGDSTPSPPAQGTASYVGRVGSATATSSGTTLTVTVGGEGIVAGHTLVIAAVSTNTGTSPTCSDNRDAANTYTRVRTAPDGGPTERLSFFTCQLATALQPGDQITVNFGASLAVRTVVVDEYAGATVTIDQQNGAAGNSASPVVTLPATAHANDLLVAYVAVSDTSAHALTDTDVVHQWTPLPAVGTSSVGGTGDKTIHPVYRVVGATVAGTYAPTLSVAAPWVAFAFALQAA